MNGDIDEVLAKQSWIQPSSAFAALVMERVERSVKAPPPIPFPWKRALPGLIYCLGAVAVLIRMLGR
jgi:hypothetical protein